MNLNADQELTAQYAEATEFLSTLAAELLNGDRQRIVIVPGNHDIDWQMSAQSMSELPPASGDELKKRLTNVMTGRSKIRWSWKSLSFFHISDPTLYARRMDR
jgi:hypothetical protein